MERDNFCPSMTEDKARRLVHALFYKWLRPGESIWLGDCLYSSHLGYMFLAGTYKRNDGLRDNFCLYGVDAIRDTVDLVIMQDTKPLFQKQEDSRICKTMTEDEARRLLFADLGKDLQINQEIWIGESVSPDKEGYKFKAGTYDKNEGLPPSFPLWSVDARTRACMPA